MVRLMLPHKMLLETQAGKVTAPGAGGSFQLLPRHVDVVWSLHSGILQIDTPEGEVFYAIDRGVLVKEGDVPCTCPAMKPSEGARWRRCYTMINERNSPRSMSRSVKRVRCC
jgi:hypothetical protein